VVLGDNGTITNHDSGALQQVVTGDPLLGGSDTISTGGGDDIVAGGAQGDTILAGAGNDVVFGDGGRVTVSEDGTRLDIVSIDVLFGGDDTLDGGAGNDVIVGGQGNDLLFGSLAEDLVFGSNAAVTLVNGLATSIFSDVQDLVTESLFALFNALPEEEQALLLDFFERLEDPSPLLDPIDQPDPLLDEDLFRKLFALGAQARALLAGGEFHAVFRSDVISEPEAPSRAPLLEPDEAAAPPPPQAGSEIVHLAGLRFVTLEAVLSALAADARALADGGAGRVEIVALMMGLAGLQSVRPQAAGRVLAARLRVRMRALVQRLRA